MAINGIEVPEYTTPQEDVLLAAEKWFPMHGTYKRAHGIKLLPDHRITLNAFGIAGEMDDYCADLSVVFDEEIVSARLTRVRHKVIPNDPVFPRGIFAMDDFSHPFEVSHPETGLVNGYDATISALGGVSILSTIMPDGSEVELPENSYSQVVPEFMAKIIICTLGDDVHNGLIVRTE